MNKREALAAKERALGNTENVPYNKVSEELADQVPNLADAYMRAMEIVDLFSLFQLNDVAHGDGCKPPNDCKCGAAEWITKAKALSSAYHKED